MVGNKPITYLTMIHQNHYIVQRTSGGQCMRTHIHTTVHTHTLTQQHMCTYMHVCMHARTHTQLPPSPYANLSLFVVRMRVFEFIIEDVLAGKGTDKNAEFSIGFPLGYASSQKPCTCDDPVKHAELRKLPVKVNTFVILKMVISTCT